MIIWRMKRKWENLRMTFAALIRDTLLLPVLLREAWFKLKIKVDGSVFLWARIDIQFKQCWFDNLQWTTLPREWRWRSYLLVVHRCPIEPKKSDDVASAPPREGDKLWPKGVWRHTPTDKAAHRRRSTLVVRLAVGRDYSTGVRIELGLGWNWAFFWVLSHIFNSPKADGKTWKCLLSKMTVGRASSKLEYRSL